MWNQSKPQICLLFYKLFLLKEIIAQTSEINPQIAEVQQIYNSLPLDTRNFIENNKEVIDLSKFLGDEYIVYFSEYKQYQIVSEFISLFIKQLRMIGQFGRL